MNADEIREKFPAEVKQIEKEAIERYLDDKRIEVDHFTFYRTYWQSARKMPKAMQSAFVMGLLDYAFMGVVPTLPAQAETAFILARPNLDHSIDHVLSGVKGGRPPKISKTNAEATGDDDNPGNRESVKEIVDYLNSKAGTRYKASTADTVRKISARLADGFSVDDCKRVIDNKVTDWLGDEKMSQYLRPATLFSSSKFEGYLNQSSEEKRGSKYADYR